MDAHNNYLLKIVFVTTFSIAMGLFESVLVIYLQELYYPDGFAFPLKQIPHHILNFEYLREISTIVMLICVGLVAGKNFSERFAYFLYSFGVWDIFYYVWLKVLINWPTSLLTWDVLFLIPVIWVGPVLAPVICSLTMILLGQAIIYLRKKGFNVKIKLREWVLIILGAVIIFTCFIRDYTKLIIEGGFSSQLSELETNPEFQKIISEYIPTYFNWYLFSFGEVLILAGILLMIIRTVRIKIIGTVKNKILLHICTLS